MDPEQTPDEYATLTSSEQGQLRAIGNYKILRLVGEGAMGCVYLACHAQFEQRRYAVKLMKLGNTDRSLVQRFQREIQVTGSFQHPNLIYAHDAGITHDGELYLVMEYVAGIDLQNRLNRQGPIDSPTAVALICQACEGLEYAHSKAIIHRDVKPSNLMVTAQGVVKVSDLGLAAYADHERELGVTAAHATLGTPHFMAPEIWGDPKAAGPASDIYATACTLYSLLAGKPPFAATTSLPQLMQAHQQSTPELTPLSELEVPQEVVEALRAGLEKQPENRPQSCAELRDKLLPYAAELQSFDVGQPTDFDDIPTYPASAAETLQNAGPTESLSSLSTWSVNEQERPVMRLLVIVIASFFGVSLVSLSLAYYGPETTEAWKRKFDLLNDSQVPRGAGFVIELVRSALFLTVTTLVLAFRFNNEVRRFWDFRQWNVKLIANRVAVFGILTLFFLIEANRHLSLEQAPAELAEWAQEHGIETSPLKEAGPYRWYLGYSAISYMTVLGGLVAFPLIRFTLSDLSFVIRRLRELRCHFESATSVAAVSKLLIHFGKECRELSSRYVVVMAAMVMGVHYDWWIGWRTLSESALQVLMIGWIVAGVATAFFVMIAGLYASAFDAAFKRVVSFGSVAQEAEISKINTLWFLRKNLLDSLSGLICLSLVIVLLRAMMR